MFSQWTPNPSPPEEETEVKNKAKDADDVAIVFEDAQEWVPGDSTRIEIDDSAKEETKEEDKTTATPAAAATGQSRTRRMSMAGMKTPLLVVIIIASVLLVAGLIILFFSLKKVPENEVGLKYKKYSRVRMPIPVADESGWMDGWRGTDTAHSHSSGNVFSRLLVGFHFCQTSLSPPPPPPFDSSLSQDLDDAAKSGGLFLGPPGFKFVKFPSTHLSVDLENTCVSRDGLLVFFQVTFQYQMTEQNLYPAALEYQDYYKWAEVVESAALSGVHHACSEFQVNEFQTKRDVLRDRMFENLRVKLEGDGSGSSSSGGVFAKAISLQLNDLELPKEYIAAVIEKQSAEVDIALARAERILNVTVAETEFLSAQEEARRILATATTEAELLLMEAKLEAEETAYAFAQESETLVNVKRTLNYTTEGVLAYMATKLIEETPYLTVSMGEPAKLSRPDEL